MKRLTTTTKNALRQIRHRRVRKSVMGTPKRPRLSVFRGLRSTIAQLVDDSTGKTLCYVKSVALKSAKAKVEGKTTKVAAAHAVGFSLAEKAKGLGITQAVFDRGGYKYHGRIQAVAEGARAGGLEF